MIYRLLYTLLLSHVDAERVHRVTARGLVFVTRIPPLRRLLRALLAPRDPALRVQALGLDFPSPLGLAAGFDKDAAAFEAYATLGFGFVEVGTITAHGQPGNPGKRIFRLTRERALVNRMGFPNTGAAAAEARLRRARLRRARRRRQRRQDESWPMMPTPTTARASAGSRRTPTTSC